MTVKGELRGSGFLVAPELALTAQHVIRTALDRDGVPLPGVEIVIELADGSRLLGNVEKCDPVLDVASIRLKEAVAEWFPVGPPMKAASWSVTTRFLDNDSELGGSITAAKRAMRNDAGYETYLTQLRIDDDLGTYSGYSGSPVCVTSNVRGRTVKVAVGVLVEQAFWRTKRKPGERQATVSNVLWAAPMPDVFKALGISQDVNPYGEWRLLSPAQGFVRTLEVDAIDPLVVYAGMGNLQGIYQSVDGGRSWHPSTNDLGCRNVRRIAVSTFDRSVYCATREGLWTSQDGGSEWREIADFHGKELLTVAVSFHDPAAIWVGCRKQGGMSVSVSSAGTARVDPQDVDIPQHTGTAGDGLKFSYDGGETWTTLALPENINSIWADPEDSRIFAIASAGEGLYFSRRGTAKLRQLPAFPREYEPICIIRLAGDGRLIVGTLHRGLYWSDDDGQTWTRSEGMPNVQVSDIRVVGATTSLVGAATPNGYYESRDRGEHWQRASVGLENPYCLAFAPMVDGSVVLGTNGGGGIYSAGRRR